MHRQSDPMGVIVWLLLADVIVILGGAVMDVPREKAKTTGSIPKGQQRAPVASDYGPGDYGYVNPKRAER